MLNILDQVSVGVFEWLRRMIRNHLGLSRAGSSPVSNVFAFFHPGMLFMIMTIRDAIEIQVDLELKGILLGIRP